MLKKYTTFQIGGPAKYFCVAKNKTELIEAIKIAKKLKFPFFVLGGGSNLLISDKGFKGLVIKFGQPLSLYVSKGLEWAVGIPGTIQGAVWSNAGAFKKSMKDVVREVEVFDTKTGKVKIFENKDCRFSYRNSIFRKEKNLIVLSVKIKYRASEGSESKRLISSLPFAATRADEEEDKVLFASKKNSAKKIKQYLDYRKKTQPLEFPSAGSIFKNPFGKSAAREGDEDKSSSSAFAAARLIEECGLKGKRIGDAEISEKHANFIVNLGGATTKDVKKLINLTKKSVKKKFKINLEEEIQFL